MSEPLLSDEAIEAAAISAEKFKKIAEKTGKQCVNNWWADKPRPVPNRFNEFKPIDSDMKNYGFGWPAIQAAIVDGISPKEALSILESFYVDKTLKRGYFSTYARDIDKGMGKNVAKVWRSKKIN